MRMLAAAVALGMGFGVQTVQDPGSDTIVWRYAVEPPTLNPTIYRDVYGGRILSYTNGALYSLDKAKAELVPEVAAQMPQISSDRLEWRVPIRKGVRWHDGKPVTSQDIKASYEIMMHPRVDAQRFRSNWVEVTEVSAVDDETIRIRFSKPSYFAIYALAELPLVPKHVVDELDDPSHWNDVQTVIGCGPYVLKHWKKGREVVLERNEDYWGAKPNFKTIRVQFIPDEEAAIAALRKGEIDAMDVQPMTWEKTLKSDEAVQKDYQRMEFYSPGYLYVGWNMQREILSSRKVRRALGQLLDVPGMIKEVAMGHATQVTGPTYFKSEQYNKEIKPLAFDPVAAAKLLGEEGWTQRNADGVLTRNGKKFEIDFVINAENLTSMKIAASAKETLGKAGIKVNVRPLQWGVLLEELNQNRFDACSLGWSWDWPETDLYQVWHSSQIANRGSNRVGFRNVEADKLLEETRAEFDREKRNALFRKLQDVIHEEQPYAFLYAREWSVLVHRRIQGVAQHPLGAYPRAGMEWWVEKGKEKYK